MNTFDAPDRSRIESDINHERCLPSRALKRAKGDRPAPSTQSLFDKMQVS